MTPAELAAVIFAVVCILGYLSRIARALERLAAAAGRELGHRERERAERDAIAADLRASRAAKR